MRAANDADFAARNAAVAEEEPRGGVGAGETDRVGAEGAFVVAAREIRKDHAEYQQ